MEFNQPNPWSNQHLARRNNHKRRRRRGKSTSNSMKMVLSMKEKRKMASGKDLGNFNIMMVATTRVAGSMV